MRSSGAAPKSEELQGGEESGMHTTVIIHSKLIIHPPFPISHCFPSLKLQFLRWLIQALSEFQSTENINTCSSFHPMVCSFNKKILLYYLNWINTPGWRRRWLFNMLHSIPVTVSWSYQSWLTSATRWQLNNNGEMIISSIWCPSTWQSE